jgi:hypothetical protein
MKIVIAVFLAFVMLYSLSLLSNNDATKLDYIGRNMVPPSKIQFTTDHQSTISYRD